MKQKGFVKGSNLLKIDIDIIVIYLLIFKVRKMCEECIDVPPCTVPIESELKTHLHIVHNSRRKHYAFHCIYDINRKHIYWNLV